MEKILDLQNQSSLAKLLATENITVTHRKDLKTAYFDVKHRVLGLPVWKDKGKVVYDMLVGHEVSHALYTPSEDFEAFIEKEGRKHFDILNIIEDIRIERLIKNKYAGLPKIFNGAYKELVEHNFFGIADKNVSEMCFLDRLNLRGKIGANADIPLNEKEEALYRECYAAETFKDVVELYHKVKEYVKEEAQAKNEEESTEAGEPQQSEGEEAEEAEEGEESAPFFEDGDGESSDDSDDGTESHSVQSTVTDEDIEDAIREAIAERSENTDDDDGEDKLGQNREGDAADSMGEDVIIEPETTKAFQDNMLDDEALSERTAPSIAIWPTKQTVKKHIVDYKRVTEDRGNIEVYFPKELYPDDTDRLDLIARLAERTAEFKKKTNKKVGVLVREFERRKASYQYTRAQESRRGSLDVNKLHKYKYDDQIFQSVMKLADAKSHGMIFFIDYSGSMAGVLKDVLEHTLNLVHFCRKVGIPFKVYSFTSNYSLDKEDTDQSDMEFDMTHLVLGELFSSEMTKSEYDNAFKLTSWQILNSSSYNFSQQGISKFEHLGGTPLEHTAIAAHHIVDEFRKKNPVQKLNVIFLTDGESSSARPSYSYKHHVLTNVGGKQREIKGYRSTETYIKLLKEVKNVNVIGFYLPNNRADANKHLNAMARSMDPGEAYSKAGKWMRTYRKDNFHHVKDCFGYDSYLLLSSDVAIKDEDFNYNKTEGKSLSDDRGEQTKLAKQFAKHNISNRTNRIIMTKFAEIIA